MDKAVKEKWITALRSGEFKQAKGALKEATDEGAKYCCLGVLATIQGVDPYSVQSKEGEYLSEEFGKELGLDFDVQQKLARMNDGTFNRSSHSFSQIADYIKEQL
jgi:hypothetical protein